ncbi:hypothetical protein HK405_005321 [Cladochytrium tenue]|nr:hypothetical protein HK405_005321 [Cladochytrium tenue]
MAAVLFIVRVWNPGYDTTKSTGDFVQEALLEFLILTVAAIPFGLPTVLSVIVKRLTAIEELASMSILCSDKTGTLTLNELTFDVPFLANKGSTNDDFVGSGVQYTDQDLLLTSFFASEPGAQDAIESAIRAAAQERVEILASRTEHDLTIPGYKINNFIPFNPTSKYTEATVTDLETGKQFRCIKGAPQVIVRMVGGHDEAVGAVNDFAKRGLRALGVARTVDEAMTKFEMVGMISLLDPPRPDSAKTIEECNELGVGVKMITGDQQIIAKEVAHRLGMNRTILDAHKLIDDSLDEAAITERVQKADGFAQVFPEHKYKVVELLQRKGFLVGMIGDGVNDAPAMKKANVGIAVQGCTDAARSAADIVMLTSGLSTIVDSVKTSRAIFQRMRSYPLPISTRPEKWRLGQLMFLSTLLGVLLMLISFAHFFTAWHHFGLSPYGDTEGVLQTIMYLQILSCQHFVIFSTRLQTWFWESMPSWIIIAIAATQVFAMFTSIYGAEVFEATSIGWPWGITLLCISTVMFMLLDVVKVLVIRFWSFEVTARLWPTPLRRAELARRQARQAVHDAIFINVDKVRKVVALSQALSAWKLAEGKCAKDVASAVETVGVVDN